ncbi:aminoglycoside phosphotransferase family protein [Phytoactinopolyspora halotolerans]|uniref:Aminoglycoside phosphotransferase family protein n=1 Tax=Phytoactinopolyspora halotolerans TaxID=1981512 RepID=A0A6L9SG60_9ACTN|nr:aminoglycoside phosphotransferase family protein [Phytoactinopolyspora halotolerans]NEE03421.1 aminoglycoside phosphotransferase family protein [Phytoactinopolyspora halotolerans]
MPSQPDEAPPPHEVAPDPAAVIAAFGLGGHVEEMTPVSGAWSNRVYKLSTGGAGYAVKQIRNPWGDPRWQERLDAAWTFEQRARAAGVAMPEPIPNPVDGGCLAWVDVLGGGSRVPVRVHAWVEGKPMRPGPVDRGVASWIGGTLATLHQLDVAVEDRTLFPVANTDNADRWPELVAAAERAGASWAADLRALESHTRVVAELARASALRADDEVMSHGDIDQKNIVMSADGPVLCDWDVAVPLVPRTELGDVAMSMAVWHELDVAREVIRAYRDGGGADTEIRPEDFGPTLTSSLDWLVLNVERTLGLRAVTEAEADLGTRLVPRLIAEMPAQVGAAVRVRDTLSV